ncbi:MAG TPA: hypothetical protein PKK00_13990 [Bacteroidales bacterium]|nr:hypothetical protein [Bacteroidales bacterium]HPS18331.1 hypothetical protein [Bacteroidales bacterium]
MKIIKWFVQAFFALVVLVDFSACSQEAKSDNLQITSVKRQNLTCTSYYDNIAQLLSGMLPDTSINEFSNIVKKSEWKSYSASFDSAWNAVNERSLKKVNTWSGSQLAEINKKTKTLFYPFSGPDFMYATTFFPNAEKYILFGLEKVGSIPDVTKLNNTSLNNLLFSVKKALQDIFEDSFFVTLKMSKQLNNADIDGVLPIILLFMARTDQKIIHIKSASITTDGNINVADTFSVQKGQYRYGKGVEITFAKKGNDSTTQKLYYFSVNFADDALAKNIACTKFLNKLDTNVTTLVKSASYLMHNEIFDFIRNIVLTKSKAILQDDSGIAYHFFDQKKWNIQFYGIYDKPIPVFSYCYQKDLDAAYKTKGSKIFDFKYGYGKGRNILLALRK